MKLKILQLFLIEIFLTNCNAWPFPEPRQKRPLDVFNQRTNEELNFLEKEIVSLDQQLFEQGLIAPKRSFDSVGSDNDVPPQFYDSNGLICMDKVDILTEIKYDERIRCDHLSYKNCYSAYKTVYKPQKTENCQDNFRKECLIEYENKANTEVVRICSTKVDRNCTIPGNKTCTIVQVTVCETKFRNYNVTNQNVNCKYINETVCFNNTSGVQDCRVVPKSVCDVKPSDLNKSFPETECRKEPCEVCGSEKCPFNEVETCQDEEKTFVTLVPNEKCELKPFQICTEEIINLPSLEKSHECVDVPKEVCTMEKVNPQKVSRPVIKKWCTHKDSINQDNGTKPSPSTSPIIVALDCDDYGTKISEGIYKILFNGKPINVYCTSDGYTVIQSRGQLGFAKDLFSNKTWVDYENGFGEAGKEFWIGLKHLYNMTQDRKYELRIDLVGFNGTSYYATYRDFQIQDTDSYSLRAAEYNGTAGDALSYHSNMKFSTVDRDNDISQSNCAAKFKGAWWYKDCLQSNLNGYNFASNDQVIKGQGLVWSSIPGSLDSSFAKVTMSIRQRIDDNTVSKREHDEETGPLVD